MSTIYQIIIRYCLFLIEIEYDLFYWISSGHLLYQAGFRTYTLPKQTANRIFCQFELHQMTQAQGHCELYWTVLLFGA